MAATRGAMKLDQGLEKVVNGAAVGYWVRRQSSVVSRQTSVAVDRQQQFNPGSG
ncbi:MAG TPA: hypothetical protein VHK68_08610 [Gemmatimonadales bacterium]|nr:hypothetical protein [Gemmatimonadales bacterium]